MTTKPTSNDPPDPSAVGASAASASPCEGSGGAARGRPVRRTLADRQQAVIQVLGGKASIDQVAARMGVYRKTIEQWCDQPIGGIGEAALRGDLGTPRELELEREVEELIKNLKDESPSCSSDTGDVRSCRAWSW
jgi:transposase-like protein